MKKGRSFSPKTHSRDYQKNIRKFPLFFKQKKIVRNLFFVKQILEQEGNKREGRKFSVFMRNSPMNKSFHSALCLQETFSFYWVSSSWDSKHKNEKYSLDSLFANIFPLRTAFMQLNRSPLTSRDGLGWTQIIFKTAATMANI